MELSAPQLAQFDQDGYVVVEGCLRDEDLDPVIEEYDRYVAEKARELHGEGRIAQVYDDEPFERALRRFSSKTKRTGLMRDIKRKRFYTKPSVQKKLDLQKSIRRRKKAARIAHLAEQGLDRRGRKRR